MQKPWAAGVQWLQVRTFRQTGRARSVGTQSQRIVKQRDAHKTAYDRSALEYETSALC
jgi:hypothetical protein